MKVKQISIFIENQIGKIKDVIKVISDSGINIRALALADTKDFGILRIIVDKPLEANAKLKESGYTVRITEVLAIEVPDEPGGLFNVLEKFEANSISIEYMYAFVEKNNEKAIMIFRIENIDGAISQISKSGINILKEDQVYNL
jgi:hypothetical protein